MRPLPRFILRIRFLRRISSSFLKRYMRAFHERYYVERRQGALLLLDQTHGIDLLLLIRGEWEQEQIAHLEELARAHRRPGEAMILLDVGSCAAYYPLTLGARVAFDEIVAFEPVPSNLAQLRANLMMNGRLDDVRIVEKAMSDREGVTEFIVSTDRNRGWSRILDDDLESGEKVIRVPVGTLDGEIDARGKLIVAKIDVEGGELRTVRGMERLVRENRAILQIERNKGPLSDLVELLAGFGAVYERTIGIDHYFLKL